jgi:hypothetical protein
MGREHRDDLVELARLAIQRREAEQAERIVRVALDGLLRPGDGLVAVLFFLREEALHGDERRRGLLRFLGRIRERFERLERGFFAVLLVLELEEVAPRVDRVRLDVDRLQDGRLLARFVLLRLVDLGKMERREGVGLHDVLSALEGALGLVELLELKLRDAQREPVVALQTALGDDLGEHALGLLELLVLEQFVRENAAAIQIVRVIVPVLLETG